MTEDLIKKLNTAGAFDTPWLKQQLESWDVVKEQQKADFIEHIYQCYKPEGHVYTGLWERFCLQEAGPYCRDQHFERLKFIKELNEGKIQEQESYYLVNQATGEQTTFE
jgi:hypothetical protein